MKTVLEALKKIDDENVEEALNSLYETGRYLPVITERVTLDAKKRGYESLSILDAVTFFYVMRGNVVVHIGDDEAHLGTLNGICIKMGIEHSIVPVGDTDPEIEIIIFHQSAVFGLGTTSLSAKYRNPAMYNKTPNYSIFNCRMGNGIAISRLMDDIYTTRKDASLGWELAVKGSLCNLWYLTIAMYRPIPVKAVEKRLSNDEYRVRRAINFIDEHYMDPITLDEIAASIHISKSECCRCFKRVMDMSPIEYVVRFRIYTAAAILDNTAAEAPSVSDLAIMTGHNNISYFIKTFKRYMGVTPTEFRENAVNNKSWVDGSTFI